MTGSMTNIAATAPIALIAAAIGPAAAQASVHGVDKLSLRAAEDFGAGDNRLADTTVRENPKRANTFCTRSSKPGHAYAARQLTHPLANPPGETEVTTKGGSGEDQ